MNNLSIRQAEGVRQGGQYKRPNRNNNVTRRRLQVRKMIEAASDNFDANPDEVALQIVEANRPRIERYVISKGEQPLQNPAELALQAHMLRQNEVDEMQNVLGCSREECETFLEQNESEADDINSADADNFIGGIVDAIGRVAARGIEKVRAKRKAKGKPTKFWDGLAKLTNSEQAANGAESGGTLGNKIGLFAKDVMEAIKKDEKRKEINKMLPYFIGGAILLILITYLISKNASK